jgi:hypothetical protein
VSSWPLRFTAVDRDAPHYLAQIWHDRTFRLATTWVGPSSSGGIAPPAVNLLALEVAGQDRTGERCQKPAVPRTPP